MKKDSLLIICLILINIVTISLLIDKPLKLFTINAILLICYFLATDRKNKYILFFASLNFAFWGVVFESLIIKNTNFGLRYKTNGEGYNVPLWLFTTYMTFLISAVFTYEAYSAMLKN